MIKKYNVAVFFAFIAIIAWANTSIAQTQWTKYSGNPVFSVSEATVLFDGSTYKMWYYTGAINYATSTDGINWVNYPNNPVLSPGPSSWDSSSIDVGSVLFDGSVYKMWYCGSNGSIIRIGYATSADGINWTKHPASPVLNIGSGWESWYVFDPFVLFDGSQYRMWYSGRDDEIKVRIGYATSTDGINWVKHPNNPVLNLGAPGSWESVSVNHPTVVFNGTIYEMWYGGGGVGKIGYATSPDGIVWTKYSGNPVIGLGPDGSWDDVSIGYPYINYNGTSYKIWYTGYDGQINRTGYATSGLVYTITATAGSNGSISPSGAVSVNSGASHTFNITPNTGYRVLDVKVDNASVGALTTYTFTNVTSNHTIDAAFTLNNWTITATAGANGSISPAGAVSVSNGANQLFTITPNTNYHVLDVKVDNVSQGQITTYTFTNVTANHTIDATFTIVTWAITATAGAGGAISPSGSVAVPHGSNQTFNITSNTGYRIKDVKADSVSQGQINTYTFTNVTANHTIDATFEPIPYTITATAGTGGAISPSGAVTVLHGNSQTFTITPNTGYRIKEIKVDNVSQGQINTYTFTNVTANHTIDAAFDLIPYTINATAGTGGAISPSGAVTVLHGNSQTFTITPNTGYRIKDAKVDSVSVSAVATYTFTNVIANHTIDATFERIPYTITATVIGTGGTISPSGTVTVLHGDSQAFNINLDTGYRVKDVKVDNVSQGQITAYTFTNVTANHTIEATIEIIYFTITATSYTGGSIDPTGQALVPYNGNQTFNIIPNTGYRIYNVRTDGSSVGKVSTWTFTNVVDNHTIDATFEKIPYNIIATVSGAGGTISPSGTVTVLHGNSQTFTMTPNTNYHVADVKVDSVSVGALTTYTFTNVAVSHTISVDFAINTSANTGGPYSGNEGLPINFNGSATGGTQPYTFEWDFDNDGQYDDGTGQTPQYTWKDNGSYTIKLKVTDSSSNTAIDTASVIVSNLIPTVEAGVNQTAKEGATVNLAPSTFNDKGSIDTHTATINWGDGTPTGAGTVSETPGGTEINGTVSGSHVYADNGTYTITITVTDDDGAAGSDTLTVTVSNEAPTVEAGANQTSKEGTTVSLAPSTFNDKGTKDTHTATIDWGDGTTSAGIVSETPTGPPGSTSGTNGTVSGSHVYADNSTYTVKVTVTDDDGGVGSDTLIVTVSNETPTVEAGINQTVKEGTAVNLVSTFNDKGTKDTHTATINWGDGITSAGIITETPTGPPGNTSGTNGTVLGSHIYSNGGVYIVTVTVTDDDTGAGSDTLEMTVIKTYTITATAGANGSISPSGAVTVNHGNNQTFTITPSANYHVVDILVDGASVGVKTEHTFTNVTAGHTISVSFAINTYIITATAGTNGSISPSGTVIVNHGANQTFTMTPSANYHVAGVLVDGVSVGAKTEHTFTNVTAGHTISVSFAINTYTITATSGANGSISPSGTVTVNHGTNQTFIMTPSANYHVADVLVDGASVGAKTEHTFTNVTAGHTISVSFAINTYIITATAGTNGSISPSGTVTVNHGANQIFTMTPSANYHVADVLVDGASVGAKTEHTFTNVTAGHTISVSFAINTYTITATTGANGSISPSGTVTVNQGSNQTFTITPSANYHVADVLVDGVSVGAKTEHTFTNVTASHTISVSFAINTYTITATAGANGSISPSGVVTVNHGANQTFTMTPAANYHVADVLVDGASVGAKTEHTFTSVTATHTISVIFAINTYTITATTGANGSISPSGTVTVNHGANQTFTMTPSANYHVADVLVDGASVGVKTEHTFTNVTAGHIISVSFAINTYTITSTAGANGSISPSGAVTVNHGANQTFTMTPSANYHVADVLVDGASIGAKTEHTFTNVTAGHTISVSFAINTYTITATTGANGSISPSGAVTALYGSNQAFTMTPDTGYRVKDVKVDGSSVGAIPTYTFTNVTANHTIDVTFEKIPYTITATVTGTGGAISPSGAVTVLYGLTQAFTITPIDCYAISDVKVDNASVGAVPTYTLNDVRADHTISAVFAIKTFIITATAGANGSISPSGAVKVNCGTNQTFTITPNDCYAIADVKVDNVSVGAVATYTFNDVRADHTISASFTMKTYTITATAGTGGSISPSGAVTVNHGANQTFTMAPDMGRNITNVLVDGVSVGVKTEYTFTNVTASHTISVSFDIDKYFITTTAGAGGSISPSTVLVKHGESQTFSINPGTGYHIADVLVDGATVGAKTEHTFTNVTTEHTISASFAINEYFITATAGTGGSITQSGKVNYGASQTFTITPNDCYAISDVKVDNASVGAVPTYTFSDVRADHNISATFVIKTNTITATAGTGGSINPSGAMIVNCGANQTFTIIPNDCYAIADVKVDNVSVGAVATYEFNDVRANHTISATFVIKTFTITATAGANGNISPSGAVKVNCGTNQTFTITPNDCYAIADVKVDNTSVGAVPTYTFDNVRADHTISATFVIRTYTVTATTGANGSISPSGAVKVNCGTNQTFNITANDCYAIADVKVDNVSQGAITTYTFPDVRADHTISATFVMKTYTITATAEANGSISLTGAVKVNCGANQVFTITPNDCYAISDVKVDNASVGAVTTYTLNDVRADHTISATFVIRTYTITATTGANGSISPSGAVKVNCGTNQMFTITASDCYAIADVKVDNVSVGAMPTYTFNDVRADHTISAAFVMKTYTITATAGANGSISPSGAVKVNCGANQTFTITPNDCYAIADVKVDNVSVGAVPTYEFKDVRADHTISAAFALKTFIITATAGTGGSISPSGAVTVNCGTSQIFTMRPDTGRKITSVFVDGASVGAKTEHTFTNVTASHTISVSFADDDRFMTATAGTNGSISPSGSVIVKHGSNQTFSINPDTGYHVEDVLVDGASVGAVTVWTFSNVTTNHTISARFDMNTYTINASAGANGSISPSGDAKANYGASQVFSISPGTGYHVDKVLVDGASAGAVNSYTFNNVTANHSIYVMFAVNVYTINASASSGGTITPSGQVMVNHGESKTFTMTPNQNYRVADVLLDGASIGAVSMFPFNNVTASHTISVVFTEDIKIYTIRATAGVNGYIYPSGDVAVRQNGSQAFTITTRSGYRVQDVLVDGKSAGSVTTFPFNNVTSDHTIYVTFEEDIFTITATASPKGKINPSGTLTVKRGGSQVFYFTPDVKCHIVDVTVDGKSAGSVTEHTFSNVEADHTISVSFAEDKIFYTITASAGENGRISPSGSVQVGQGESRTWTITPDAGCHVEDVKVDGKSVGAVPAYTFSDVKADHIIGAAFDINKYTIEATAYINGSISPSGQVQVKHGESRMFLIAPNVGHHIKDVRVDGQSIGAVTSHTFYNVTINHTISAEFEIDKYRINTAVKGTNGSISPSGEVIVNHGGSQTFQIEPKIGCSVLELLIDGKPTVAVTTYTFSNVTSDHTISVSFAEGAKTINASAGKGGSINPSGAVNVSPGGSMKFSITPDAGYHVADVKVDGNSFGAVAEYTFDNVTANHTIDASFEIIIYTITASADTGGKIDPSGKVKVKHGENQVFSFTPDADYKVKDVLVDGKSAGAMTTYTFTNVASDHTISVVFGKGVKIITATAGANGKITPSGEVAVIHGGNQAFSIIPYTGHHIADVLVDGVSAGAVTEYTFKDVTSVHSIYASFAVDTRVITAKSDANGNIYPSGTVKVNYGSSQMFSINPDPCYRVADVLVDGKSVGVLTIYTFMNVSRDQTIEVKFEKIPYKITANVTGRGKIDPSGQVTVLCGENKAFNMTADEGYRVADVLVDDNSVDALAKYTFTNVTSDHTVAVIFELIPETERPGFKVSALKSVMPVTDGSAVYTIMVEGKNGLTGGVSLYAILYDSGLPDSVKVAFNPKKVNLSLENQLAASELKLTVPKETPPGDYPFSILARHDSGETKELKLTLKVNITPASLSINLQPQEARFLGKMSLLGQLVALSEEPAAIGDLVIKLTFTSPGGKTKTFEAKTSSNGGYKLEGRFSPDEVGWWFVKAAFEGNGFLKSCENNLSFEVRKGLPEIVFDTSTIDAMLGKKVMVVGRMEPQLKDELITLKILRPSKQSTIIPGIVTEVSGIFRYEIELDTAGDWEITAAWTGNDLYEGVSQTLGISVSKEVGKVILVLGGGNKEDDPDFLTSSDMVSYVHNILVSRRGFDDEKDVYFLSPDPKAKSADNVTSISSLEFAITRWAAGQVNSKVPLYIYMLSHNLGDQFLLEKHGDQETYLTPAQLDAWLDKIPKDTPVTIIIEACHSGNYIRASDGKPTPLAGTGRTIIATARGDKHAWISPGNLCSFSKYFFDRISANKTIAESFQDTEKFMARIPFLRDQYPEMDGDGDGKINLPQDYAALAGVYLPANFISKSLLPEIIDATPPRTLPRGVSSLKIYAKILGASITSVTAMVIPPDMDKGVNRWSDLQFPEFDLAKVPGKDNEYAAAYADFTKPGDYTVIINAENPDGCAIPVQTTVTVLKPIKKGDVNGDGKVNSRDAMLVLQFAAGLKTLTDDQKLAADMNDDGKVDSRDIILILQKASESAAPGAGIARNALFQNYPNPFNPETWIPYQLAEDAVVVVRIYNSAGQIVRTLDLGYRQAGFYASKASSAYWDGRNESGEYTASGVYFYTIQAGDFTAVRKMLITR